MKNQNNTIYQDDNLNEEEEFDRLLKAFVEGDCDEGDSKEEPLDNPENSDDSENPDNSGYSDDSKYSDDSDEDDEEDVDPDRIAQFFVNYNDLDSEVHKLEKAAGDDEEDADDYPEGKLEQSFDHTIQLEILRPIKNPREELEKLVGCQDIKHHIDEMLTVSRYNRMRRFFDPDSKIHSLALHSIFFGRPGTGKTTVCRIFGSLLKDAGVLSKGHVVVCDRSTFIGKVWGNEEQAVRDVVEMAKGGVLMIDEAYQLNSSDEKDPGRRVLPLLMSILADETKRNIAVVLCGYKDEMERLLEMNPGLISRFPNRFEFPDFTIEELLEITRRRIRDYNYNFTHAGWIKFKALISAAYATRDPKTWGNARFIANQLERIYICHARRCVYMPLTHWRKMSRITPADIQPIEVPKAKRRIGF